MVELFKTNVTNETVATLVLGELHAQFSNCRFNFDLKDRDHLLRVECSGNQIHADEILSSLKALWVEAAVLEDEVIHPSTLPTSSMLYARQDVSV